MGKTVYKLGLYGFLASTTFLFTSNDKNKIFPFFRVEKAASKNNLGECIPGHQCVRGIGSENMNYSFVPNERRQCGEEIFHFSKREVWFITNVLTFSVNYIMMPLDMFSKELGDFKDSILNFQSTHGVKAIKICGSCDELRDNSDQIKGFEEYCGKNVYGNNETVTGLMLVPTDPTTMEMKAGGLDTAIWMHGFVSHLGPSEILPKTSFSWFAVLFETAVAFMKGGMTAAYDKDGKSILGQLSPLMLASRGVLVLSPDYLGYSYGNDKALYKGAGILSFYQTSTLPLWFKSKSTIEKISGGESHMLDNAYVHGASEGGMATMPVAHRLHEMGVNVHAYPAAVPNYVNTDVEIMKRMYRLMKGEFPLVFMSFFGYLMTPFSSISPYTNVPKGQGLASDQGEEALDLIVNNEISFGMGSKLVEEGFSTSPDCLRNGTGCPTYLNPKIVKAILEVEHMDPWNNTEYLPCQSKNEVPELSMLCAELSKVGSHQFFAVAEYPVHICHHSLDKVSKYVDMTKMYPENENINEFPSQEQWALAEKNRGVKLEHSSSAFACNFRAILDILTKT